ncbi:MAG: hypothetical protein M0Z54_14570 [Thermaerobacter sp.]|nr:hypothetical protein [Thermaerobacter sp.]
MIRAETPVWTGREWHCRVAVREGVYQRADYPVTITYLGPVADGEDRAALLDALRRVVEGMVAAHLWKGSLAPAGMLVNWREQQDERFAGKGLDAVRALADWLDGRVGRMSHADGHGYYHARDRRPTMSERKAPEGAASSAAEIERATPVQPVLAPSA